MRQQLGVIIYNYLPKIFHWIKQSFAGFGLSGSYPRMIKSILRQISYRLSLSSSKRWYLRTTSIICSVPWRNMRVRIHRTCDSCSVYLSLLSASIFSPARNSYNSFSSRRSQHVFCLRSREEHSTDRLQRILHSSSRSETGLTVGLRLGSAHKPYRYSHEQFLFQYKPRRHSFVLIQPTSSWDITLSDCSVQIIVIAIDWRIEGFRLNESHLHIPIESLSLQMTRSYPGSNMGYSSLHPRCSWANLSGCRISIIWLKKRSVLTAGSRRVLASWTLASPVKLRWYIGFRVV